MINPTAALNIAECSVVIIGMSFVMYNCSGVLRFDGDTDAVAEMEGDVDDVGLNVSDDVGVFDWDDVAV
jgi:hypothetical protein